MWWAGFAEAYVDNAIRATNPRNGIALPDVPVTPAPARARTAAQSR